MVKRTSESLNTFALAKGCALAKNARNSLHRWDDFTSGNSALSLQAIIAEWVVIGKNLADREIPEPDV